MLDIKFIRENPDKIKEACRKKQADFDVDKFLEVDKKRREMLANIEKLRSEQNQTNISAPSKDDGLARAKEIKQRIKKLEPKLEKIESEFNVLARQIPNLPLDNVPEGKNGTENVVLREEGEKPKFDFKPKDYLEIAEKLDWIDVKRAAKTSGSRFGFIKGDLALLEFALISLSLEVLVKDEFIPIIPPILLNEKSMAGMGYLDRAREEVYHLEKDNLFLAGTAEQPLGSMHMDEVFKVSDLPRRYVGFSACFRREAGSYGKDTRGILRVHQFDKLEMFSFVKPEDSQKEHEFLLGEQEKLMKLLKIPYQIVQICTGDLGEVAANKFDIEAWLPGQNIYRETHSTSNCTDYQSRRLNIRYQAGGKKEFVHTLNGTGLAIGRTLIAIIENYQRADGSVETPEALKRYLEIFQNNV